MADRMESARVEDQRALLLGAFPSAARAAAESAVALMPVARHRSIGAVNVSNNRDWPAVTLGGETLTIPHRIYNPPLAEEIDRVSPDVRAAVGCLYTRHHDGWVRQRALSVLLSEDREWFAPFVVQLLGEYVVEICLDVERFFQTGASTHPRTIDGLRRFMRANPDFVALTRARAASYWHEYYRSGWPAVGDFPAFRALALLDELVSIEIRGAWR